MKAPHAAGLVVTACTLAACRTTAPEPKPADGASPATVVIPATTATPSSSANAAPLPPAPRLLGFLRSASWQKFRERWRTIDAVPSGDAARGSTNDPKVQEAGRLALEALDELEKDPLAEGIEPGTFQALKFVVSNRIAVLSGLEFRLMVAHMMPSGSDMARARAGASLEQRIDALIELRKKGALTPEERDLALRGITNRIHLLVVLQSMHGYFMSDPLERAESLEDLQRVLEARRASDSGAKDLVEQLEKGLAEARSMAPVLDAMVADLER